MARAIRGDRGRSRSRAPADARPGETGRLPNFVVIGAQRSGTSYLALNLRNHPDVFMSKRKELDFFTDNYELGIDWYRRQFAGAEGKRAVGEATPQYMHFEPAIPRMAEVIPDARLIATLRNPVDRAYSHWLKERSWNRETLEFADAIAAEAARLRSGDLADSRYGYLHKGRYLSHLRRVREYFSPSSLLVVIFEEMKQDPVETHKRIFDFLGVDDSFVSPEIATKAQAYRTYRSKALHRAFGRLPRGKVRSTLQNMNFRHPEPPRLDPSLRARLLDDFAEDNAALAAWLGRDLDLWNH